MPEYSLRKDNAHQKKPIDQVPFKLQMLIKK
jgi:hypothetical protein